MRKLILVVTMFMMFACTLGQTPPKQSATASITPSIAQTNNAPSINIPT